MVAVDEEADRTVGGGKPRNSSGRGYNGDMVKTIACEDQYYTRDDYAQLSPGNHKWLKLYRDGCVESAGDVEEQNAHKQ